jgi:hypothetical protein
MRKQAGEERMQDEAGANDGASPLICGVLDGHRQDERGVTVAA